ncbi:hypothetical protein AAEX28_10435 [Lentisphaerota bacterium WC36G]|nr:hypothetical protein LJT99_13275 [Lentisphaerae bacterium WC36]
MSFTPAELGLIITYDCDGKSYCDTLIGYADCVNERVKYMITDRENICQYRGALKMARKHSEIEATQKNKRIKN